MSNKTAIDPQYWGNHMQQPVRFVENIQALLAEKPDVILEVGSPKILSKLLGKFTQEWPEVDCPFVLPCLRHPRDPKTSDSEAFTQAITTFWQAGGTLDWQAFHRQQIRRRIALPTYQFDRQRCWPEKPKTLRSFSSGHVLSSASTEKIADIRDRAYIPSWARSVVPVNPETATRQAYCWLVLMDGTLENSQQSDRYNLGFQLAQALEQQGDTVVRVFRSIVPKPSNTLGYYTLNPSQPDAYQDLLAHLQTLHLYPNRISDLWNLTENQNLQWKDSAVLMVYFTQLALLIYSL
ncbi:MAG: hypothetical protein AAGD25_15720 [Cyanobacteria bacterium P01_F01_bin.150]